MDLLPEPLRTILAFLLVLGVLIAVHEFGHYLAARWRGVHADAFSIGFGGSLVRWRDRRGTEWRIGWLPLGGYVKMRGREGQLEDAGSAADSQLQAGSFNEKSVLDRAIIIAAGPVANFLLALVLYTALAASVGVPQPVRDAVVATVAAGSAAERAGIREGDRVVAIDGTPMASMADIRDYVTPRSGARLQLLIERAGQNLTMDAVPDNKAPGGGGVLGVSGALMSYVRVGPVEAVASGATMTAAVSWLTLKGVWGMISGAHGTEDIGGPLRIAQVSGQAAEMGLAALASFMAVLSVNLGIMNLVPIPVLDGGHLLFYAAEALRGRPLPAYAQSLGLRIGALALMALLVFATWNDLSNLGVVRWVTARFVG